MAFKNKSEYNPYRYHPVYCKACGQELKSKRDVDKKIFDDMTGKPLEHVRYVRYCPDWWILGHTNYWGNTVLESSHQE